MPAWPASLPQLVQEQGFSESLPDQFTESPMDSGASKSRRRTTAAWRPIQCVIWCTSEQAGDFEDFYLDDLKGGVLSFTWVDPSTQNAATFRFKKPVPRKTVFGADNVAYALNLWRIA